jgi:hypothetical protein
VRGTPFSMSILSKKPAEIFVYPTLTVIEPLFQL